MLLDVCVGVFFYSSFYSSGVEEGWVGNKRITEYESRWDKGKVSSCVQGDCEAREIHSLEYVILFESDITVRRFLESINFSQK